MFLSFISRFSSALSVTTTSLLVLERNVGFVNASKPTSSFDVTTVAARALSANLLNCLDTSCPRPPKESGLELDRPT